jgi:HK97 family phage major capsid protein
MSRDVHNALSALGEAVATKNAATEKNVREFFSEYEDKNQQLIVQNALVKKRLRRLEENEGAVISPADWDVPDRSSAEYKSFIHWLSQGKAWEFKDGSWSTQGLDFKTLRTDAESAGGYLIPQVMDNHIRRNIIEISPIRRHARVRVSPSKTLLGRGRHHLHHLEQN